MNRVTPRDHPAHAFGGDVEHREHRREDRQRRSEVGGVDGHAERQMAQGGQAKRAEIAGPREVHAEEVFAGRGEQGRVWTPGTTRRR